MKKELILIGGAATILGIVAFFALRQGEPQTPTLAEKPATMKSSMASSPSARKSVRTVRAGKSARTLSAAAKATTSSTSPTAKPQLKLDVDEDTDDDGVKRTPAEKALARQIQKALDEENFEATVACARAAQNCRVVGIRQAMVDALGWFGQRALPELAPFLADADEDVRDSAKNEWTMAISDIEDEVQKIKTVELAMGVLNDVDTLEEISSEYIGVDEKLAVESLLRLIEGNGSAEGITKAKETYEFVTGDEFVDRAAAEKWLAEEYIPPESESLTDKTFKK